VIIGGSSDANEVRWAKRILPLRRTGNLLLCTLLLGNTLVNALIAILLAGMTSGTVGAVATTLLIVLFGEIGPQAACSRYALQIGAAATPLVWAFVVLMFPFAYPVSKCLDYLLGGEVAAAYQRSELVSLIKLNVEDAAHAEQSGLTANDGKLLTVSAAAAAAAAAARAAKQQLP
jgi:metal transporter CNNM